MMIKAHDRRVSVWPRAVRVWYGRPLGKSVEREETTDRDEGGQDKASDATWSRYREEGIAGARRG
jgi:hypothetical protein